MKLKKTTYVLMALCAAPFLLAIIFYIDMSFHPGMTWEEHHEIFKVDSEPFEYPIETETIYVSDTEYESADGVDEELLAPGAPESEAKAAAE